MKNHKNNPTSIEEIVRELTAVTPRHQRLIDSSGDEEPLPSRDEIARVCEDLRSVFFPGYFGFYEVGRENIRFHVGSALVRVRRILERQVKRGFCFACEETDRSKCPECVEKSARITEDFLAALPRIQALLATDVNAAFDGDPAATSPDEAIFCYPGVAAVTNHRVAHELHRLGVPLIPRIINELAHSATGIDIHPGAAIGEEFFIDHGNGVVIGETCVIGRHVRIYQGVTLGGRSYPVDEHGRLKKGIPRHPVVEDDVVIYAGATILGRVTIGKGAIIGGNVWLTEDVPPGGKVTQQSVG